MKQIALSFLALVALGACALRKAPKEALPPCTGVVLEEGSNDPLLAVSMGLKGKRPMALTDSLGRFTLEGVSPGDSLAFSCLGYALKAMAWQGKPLRVYLKRTWSSSYEDPVVTRLKR